MSISRKARLLEIWELKGKVVLLLLLAALAVIALWLVSSWAFTRLQPAQSAPGSSGFIGVFGALLGATVGGTLSFLAAIYGQRRQAAGRAAVNRKNTIYTPLYDELTKVKKILEENPYPLYFKFELAPQTMKPHPQFNAWERIKRDSRRIQVPRYLAVSLEDYTDSVKGWLRLRSKACNDIQLVVNNILWQDHGTECTITNIGQVLLSDVILRGDPYYGLSLRQRLESHLSGHALESGTQLSPSQLDRLEPKIFEQCNELDSVKQLTAAYADSMRKLDDLLEALGRIIRIINRKYEIHRGWF